MTYSGTPLGLILLLKHPPVYPMMDTYPVLTTRLCGSILYLVFSRNAKYTAGR